MVHAAYCVVFFAAVGASATPSTPIAAFESDAALLQSTLALQRSVRLQTNAAGLAAKFDAAASDLAKAAASARRLRGDLNSLESRVRRYEPPRRGRPESDPTLRWDARGASNRLSQLSQELQSRLNELRFLSAQIQKDKALVTPASRLFEEARRLKSETAGLSAQARSMSSDFSRAGLSSEGWDVDRSARDADARASDLQNESARLLAKVRD